MPHTGLGALPDRPAHGRAERGGGICFHGPPLDGATEIGFELAPGARGRGYATEALQALAGWALRQPGVHRVTATTAPGNLPSQRVMDRAGFRRTEDADGLRTYALTRS
ncbi:GNAT family N-acetyltransferase [Peterkaempfera sp. SMS 1(5)a]|uniref:GNAT family N-acetyltransferase n=1 Tax=Peterkaempfera podocarpi TaxID=3232308 RepID=UPI00366AAF05